MKSPDYSGVLEGHHTYLTCVKRALVYFDVELGMVSRMLTETEKQLFAALAEKGVQFENPSWESCRKWLNDHEWKINVLSDYPRGEVKFTVRHGFERIEITGMSDLEVMAKAILEIARRNEINSED